MKQGNHKYLKLIRAYCKAHGQPIHGPTRIVILRGIYSSPYFTGVKGHYVDSRTGQPPNGKQVNHWDKPETPKEFIVWVKSTYRVEIGAQWVQEKIPEAWLDICTLILKGKGQDILTDS